MGLLSLLGKAAVTIATNLDKVDTIDNIVDIIPESVTKAKGILEKVKDMAFDADVSAMEKRKEKEAHLRQLENKSAVTICPEMLFDVTFSIPCKYKYIKPIGNDYLIVEDNDKCGVCDVNNNIILPIEYDVIEGFSEGLFAVGKNSKYGFVNEKNEVIIDFIYNDAKPFSFGIAPVRFYEKKHDENNNFTHDYTTSWGYIDKNGNYVISPKYYSAETHIDNGLALVETYRKEKNLFGLCGVIDIKGNEIVPCNYDFVRFYPDFIECSKKTSDGEICYSDHYYDLNGTPIPEQHTGAIKEIEVGIFKTYTEPTIHSYDEKNVHTHFKGRTMYLYDVPGNKCGWYEVIDEKPICRIEPIYDGDIRILQTKCEGIYSIVRHGGLYGIIKINEKKNEI